MGGNTGLKEIQKIAESLGLSGAETFDIEGLAGLFLLPEFGLVDHELVIKLGSVIRPVEPLAIGVDHDPVGVFEALLDPWRGLVLLSTQRAREQQGQEGDRGECIASASHGVPRLR